MKDYSRFPNPGAFPEPAPRRRPSPEPKYAEPAVGLIDKLLGRKSRILDEAQKRHAYAHRDWGIREKQSEEAHRKAVSEWEARRGQYLTDIAAKKGKFEQEQASANAEIDKLAANVAIGDTQAVIEHASMVLENSDYEGLFEPDYSIDYLEAEKTLLLEYRLPSPDEMPTLKSVRFVASTGEMKETHISEREQKSNYDSVCYQICLRTIHELFEADEFENISKILFNGVSTYVDRASGREVTSTIMSIMVDRTAFTHIDLARVDPKMCFKGLKGVSAASLAALAPIPPIMTFNKEDRRFIDPRSVAPDLSATTNLASMPWEDFEHLVREVFEKEFARHGGEVKITQSSSDGGVDAVAFDPDPITGGKIVIQAKRYTRTVGVAAVRDLYGTMQHERASRGILVTTADYGPDAYQFSNEKHITLMTGANLLYLLEQHGIAARIDLRDARRELNLRDYGR